MEQQMFFFPEYQYTPPRRGGRKYTHEEEQALVRLHLKGGRSIRGISKDTGTDKNTIKSILRRHGVPRYASGCVKKPPLTASAVRTIKEMIDRGYSSEAVATFLKISPGRVLKTMKLYGIKHRPVRYIDPCFFLNLNSISAYIIGLLAADGNVSGNSISLTLKDGDLINDVAIAMGGNIVEHIKTIPPKITTRATLYCITFSCIPSRDALRSYGIVPAKSLILEFPQNIPNKLMSHYIRGVFDGDGHVRTFGRGASIYSGSEAYIAALVKHLNHECAVDSYPILAQHKTQTRPNRKTGHICTIKVRGAHLFGRYIYQDMKASDIFLCRKREEFENRAKYLKHKAQQRGEQQHGL